MTTAEINLKQDDPGSPFEICFDLPVVPEVVIGRLSDVQAWANFSLNRLPSADMPHQMRMMDELALHAPSYELTSGEAELLRIGPNSLSYHRMAPYPGWSQQSSALKQVVENLFKAIQGIKLLRLGLRYINALNGPDHKINSAADLALKIVAGEGEMIVPTSFALNYRQHRQSEHVEQVQVATPDYVQSQVGQPEFSVIVDIDIFTPDSHSVSSVEVFFGMDRNGAQNLERQFLQIAACGYN
jgi:uncharacterized protein (TIGR04255 family)